MDMSWNEAQRIEKAALEDDAWEGLTEDRPATTRSQFSHIATLWTRSWVIMFGSWEAKWLKLAVEAEAALFHSPAFERPAQYHTLGGQTAEGSR